jgi:hypothetical protein
MKMPAMTRYGPRIMLASIARYASRSAGDMAASSAPVCSTPLRMNVAPMMGVITAPSELNACAVFNRHGAEAAGPSVVTYGLAPTSRKACPHASTNNAPRNNGYARADAAGMNSAAPIAHTMRPVTMPPR